MRLRQGLRGGREGGCLSETCERDVDEALIARRFRRIDSVFHEPAVRAHGKNKTYLVVPRVPNVIFFQPPPYLLADKLIVAYVVPARPRRLYPGGISHFLSFFCGHDRFSF